MSNYCILQADYNNPQHGRDIIALLDHYAQDPMGGGATLAPQVRATLIDELAQRPYALSVLCYANQVPIGLANCFEGFSSFRALPLINVHDLVVHQNYRGQGVSQRLLDEVQRIAKARNCCKITLEVLQGNESAKRAYEKFGFAEYQLDPKMGSAMFLQKDLTD